MNRFGWSILCDFDGTIAVDDVVDLLLERYGLQGWQQLERNWRAGVIGSRECMRGQVELLQVSPGKLDEYLDTLRIDPAFPAFVAKATELGIPIVIGSDGLDYAIRRMLDRAGLQHLPIAANRLVPAAEPGRWRMSSPFKAVGCGSGTCKCELSALAPEEGSRTLLIGDGASDFCVAGRANFVFAKGRLIEHCRDNDIPHLPIADFADALDLLPGFNTLARPDRLAADALS